ncbi:OsmC family protein [Pseudahrensia aquimaris]|uniref:OsmC family protein n=1 Tax=Pseudahrensia aquimaris TaxID=744461 RepID=A0ABW3FAG5_9HYPH
MKTAVKLRVQGECPSHSLSEITVRDTGLKIDEPVERGGTNLGPTPTDTALAALIGCTNVIGHKCAASLGLDIGKLDISAVCDFDRRGVTLEEEIDVPFQRIALKVITSNAVSDTDLVRLAAEVAKFCPLAKLFRQAGTIIDEEWVSASA